ncbi:MAG: hypothetical protein WC869_11295 [Phycisphaerae bacterium]|jgi:hypothetical protein
MKRIHMFLAAAILAMPALAAAQTQSGSAEVPVSRVVLFSSGVGYFEHAGTVEGSAVLALNFKTDQINDVLKSMLLEDTGGGTITSVNYASRDPLTRALKSFAIDISGDPTMAALLGQIRGAEVTVQAPDKIVGRVLGIEMQTRQVGTPANPTVLTEAILNLVTAEGIKSLPLNSIQNIALSDARLAGELNKALALLLSARDTERKDVDIHFAGKGKRAVRIGYVVETPVWKTSYRLELGEKKPMLQGWAIVENTTDADWNNVQLSLVSGRPISFIQDLYTPLYLPRPTVVPEMYASLRPQMYDEGMVREEKAAAVSESTGGQRLMVRAKRSDLSPAPMPSMAGGNMVAAPSTSERVMDLAAMAPVADAAKVGELFNYSLKEAVSLPRQRSAMLPIINSAVSAEKVSIYNSSVMPRNPLNGAWLTNDTGLKLLGGPMTVLDEGIYAGDARIDNLVPGDKRLISYAVDLNVTVDPSEKNDSRITAVRIVKGALNVRRMQTFSQTYAIHNKADAKRTIIVEHPFLADRKLIAPEKFEEKTPAMYRFRQVVDANATKDLVVKEERTDLETIGILDGSTETFAWYTQQGEISKAVKEALVKVIAMRQKLTDLQARAAELDKQLQTIKAGQDRLRKNIETAGRESSLGKRYLEKLSSEENAIEQLDKTLADTRAAIDKQNNELAEYVNNLNVE